MRWQRYVVLIKIFHTVFDLTIVVEMIIHPDFLYKMNIHYVAVSPLTETLFCIMKTLRSHVVLMLFFPSYQSRLLHRQNIRNMIYCLYLPVHCRYHRPSTMVLIVEWTNTKDTALPTHNSKTIMGR